MSLQERVIWQGYPSWADHALLFFFMGIALVRTLFALRVSEWLTVLLYGMAILFFSSIAIFFHYVEFYHISSQRIRVISGLRTSKTSELLLDSIQSITIRSELFNDWFNLGSIEIKPKAQSDVQPASFILKGIPNPEVLKRKVDILAELPERASS
jgi:uncharacterized membrane protein YdbT with pleckstrin-like domain